jgi:hypothetical protein
MIGERFGRLTAVKEVARDKPGRWFVFRCDCGEFACRAGRNVRSVVNRGSTPACLICSMGLITSNGRRNRTHGFTVTHKRLYDVHRQMMRRCYDDACADWPNYGGRGIVVCRAWRDRSEFIRWALTNGYEPGLTIERADVDGSYEPENCCWIPNQLQAHNTRKVSRLEVNGVARILSEWSAISGVSVHTIKGRLSRGWAPEAAVFEPGVRGRNQHGRPA